MKLLFITAFALVSFLRMYGQHTPIVRLGSFEYVWSRHQGDDRVVLAKDTAYQYEIKRSFIKAISAKWNIDTGLFTMQVNKLSAIRFKPKFNPSPALSDTTDRYLFFQVFDESVAVNGANSMLGSIMNIKFRVLDGAGKTIEDKSTYFRIIKRNAPPGEIINNHFPFHPTQLSFVFDTIANSILNDALVDGREISVDPACFYREELSDSSIVENEFRYGDKRNSLVVQGEHGFSVAHDSVEVLKIGRRKHVGANIASTALTLFSNIDTDKKRSVLYTAHHMFTADSAQYHCLISYSEVKTADRRRVKDDDGYKSIEVSEYNSAWKEIDGDVPQFIILNNDTISSFKIKYRREQQKFDRMWDGKNEQTIDSLAGDLGTSSSVEMQITGTLNGKTLLLATSNAGRTKEISINGEKIFWFYQNNDPVGRIVHRGLNKVELQTATILSLISDTYMQY